MSLFKTTMYKIVCKNSLVIEMNVGATINFNQRKAQHKISCNNLTGGKAYDLKVYRFIRENGGWDNWDMEIIENYDAIDGLDARKRERYLIESLQATLNSNMPVRTSEELKLILKEKVKNYREKIIELLTNPLIIDYSNLDNDFVTDLLLETGEW